ncbi:MAG: type II/IV secretion system ATPase subunit [Candidatus Aenigmarchaeota archaeon]|nr:type II/IV secretion system ATPase subunit [Candidatus Aenigmarchaeota archaeon]
MIGGKIFRDMVRGYRLLNASRTAETMPAGTPVMMQPQLVQILQQQLQLNAAQQSQMQTTDQQKLELELELEHPEERLAALKAAARGVEIPDFKYSKVKPGEMRQAEERLQPIVYPLIPSKPAKGEPVFAYAKIAWDDRTHKYMYSIVEPELQPKLKQLLARIKDLMEQKLDVDFSKLKRFEATDYITKQMDDLIEYFDFHVNEYEKQVLRYYVERDFMGLGRLEPMMRDDNIEDISCDGVGIPIFIFHRNAKLGSTMTNVEYDDAADLDSFITRLSQLCGKSLSVAEPLVDGGLPDGSRLQATLATDIARRGSNFTIRKFTKEPLTPIHLLAGGTLDVRSLAYLWFAVDNGASLLVCGGTASGKTTLLNVLSLFIRPDKKIVSIEDTAELQLPHPHWVPTVARTTVSSGGTKARGDVDMFDLLRESFRQRPDYIIVGEVRGQEAYILFQQMATGHPSLATIHAENLPKLVDRLTTPPISLPPSLVGSLDLMVFMARMKYKDKFVRRVTEIVEMVDYDTERNKPMVSDVFKWNSENDKFESHKSVVLRKIMGRTGMKEKEVTDEIERRMVVLEWMRSSNVLDYEDVNKVINMYYSYPQRTISMIMERM